MSQVARGTSRFALVASGAGNFALVAKRRGVYKSIVSAGVFGIGMSFSPKMIFSIESFSAASSLRRSSDLPVGIFTDAPSFLYVGRKNVKIHGMVESPESSMINTGM